MSILSKNIIYNFAGKIILLLLSLVAVKNIFSELGKDIFGIIYFSEIISMIIALVIDKSTRFTIVREISTNIENNPEYIRKFIKTYLLVIWAIFLTTACSIYLVAPYVVNNWLKINTLDPDLAITVFRTMSIIAIASLLLTFYKSILDGTQRMELTNILDIIVYAAQRLGIVIILKVGGGLYYTLLWFCASTTIHLLLINIFIWKVLDIGCIVPGFFKGVLRRSAGFNIKMLLAAFFNVIQQNFDALIVSKLLPVVNVGYYTNIKHITGKTSLITGAISKAAYPSVCESYGCKDKNGFNLKYRKLNDLVCLTSISTFTFGLFISFPILAYIFGEIVAHNILIPFFLLLLGQYMNSLITVPWMYSLVVGRPEITTRANFISLVIFTPISYLLIANFGIKGAGFSIVIYNIFYWIYALPLICKNCLHIPFTQWQARILKLNAFVLAPYILILISIVWFLDMWTICSAVAAYILATTLSLVISWRIIDNDLKDTILRNFGKIIPFKSIKRKA